MQVTLRKAHKIQKDLESIASQIEVAVPTTFSVYTDFNEESIGKVLAEASDTASQNRDKYVKVIGWVYDIRKSIHDVNVTSGIDSQIADLARIDKMLSVLAPGLAGVTGRKVRARSVDSTDNNPSVIVRKMDMLKNKLNQPTDRYGSVSTESLSVVVQADSDVLVKSLKKEKMGIEEALTGLNSNLKVTLSSEVEAFLSEEGLI